MNVCLNFQIKNGWRFKKRPGVDYFLQAIGPPLFETVVYTSETGMVKMFVNTILKRVKAILVVILVSIFVEKL